MDRVRSPDRWRRRAGHALVVVTALLLAAAAVSGYARSALVDEREFSDRAASALDDADVRAVVADRVVGGLTRSVIPDALAVRPLVVAAVAELAGTSPFRRLFTRAVSDRHRALINGETTFGFELPLGEGLVFESLRSVSPRVARAIPPDLRVPIVRLDPRDFELAGARVLTDLAGWWWPLLAAALLAATGCALLAGGVRTALVYLGVAAAGGGLVVAAAVAGLGEFVVSHAAHAADLSDEAERDAVRALWAGLFSDLLASALFAALGGAVVVVLASGGLPTRYLAEGRQRALRLAGSSSRPARLGRAAGLIALGAALVLAPALVGRVVLVGSGVLLVLVGVAQIAGVRPEGEPLREPGRATPLTLAGGMAAAVVVTVLAVSLVLPGPRAAPVASAGPADGCNGSPALCDRRLNEVVFPATHNSFAAADEPGWLFANHRHGIERQLRDGIRALLIDIHYGVPDPASGRVRTDLAGEDSSRNKVARELGPEALRAADRLAGRVGVDRPAGDRRPYLCHTLCELGAEPLVDQLELVRAFLAANGSEVVVLFIEPYVPVEEIEKALDQAGLLAQAARISRDEPLPTLGDLVRAETRLVILSEQDGGARPWYLAGFSFAQDTPLGATSADQFRCRRFRGSADSPLFLINHWIDTFPPSPSRNERIGGRVLQQRLSQCERSRGLLPNLIAVDFHERSDVVEIARRLNAARR